MQHNYFIQTYTWNPWRNLAAEKYLADRIGEGDVVLYLWQNEQTVVIGRNQNAIRECRAQLLEEEGGFLARRTTGEGRFIRIWETSALLFWPLRSAMIWRSSFRLSRGPAGSSESRRNFPAAMM